MGIPIDHLVNKVTTGPNEQRSDDGYLLGTAMCQATGKRWNDYRRNTSTIEFLEALARLTGIPTDRLVQPITSSSNEQRGTWGYSVRLQAWSR
jgi:hypothetical protein